MKTLTSKALQKMCSQCGTASGIARDHNFCWTCGTPLTIGEPNRCECGHVRDPIDRHCPKCGKRVKSRPNADLIAAAPAMLEALKHALRTLDNMTSEEFRGGADRPLRELLNATVAKAEGRP